MRTNTDLTLYNRRVEGKQETFVRTVIQGVSWFSRYKTGLTEKGLVGANEISIRIPVSSVTDGKQYTPPHLYDKSDPEETWTLRPGDWVVSGVAEEAFASLSKANLEAVQIRAVSDRRDARLSPHTHHWRVMA